MALRELWPTVVSGLGIANVWVNHHNLVSPSSRFGTRAASCFIRHNDIASSTTSFIRNGTLPVIAGNPPVAASQPSGMDGMIVTVAMKVPVDPRA